MTLIFNLQIDAGNEYFHNPDDYVSQLQASATKPTRIKINYE